MFTAGTGRKIDRYDAQAAEVEAQVAPLHVNFRNADAFDDTVWFQAGIDSDAAVTLLLGTMEIAVIAIRRGYFSGQISHLRLEFLYADDIGGLLGKPLEKSLACG